MSVQVKTRLIADYNGAVLLEFEPVMSLPVEMERICLTISRVGAKNLAEMILDCLANRPAATGTNSVRSGVEPPDVK